MTATTTLPVLFATGIHSARPAANAVGAGALYSCTTHSLVYQSDGVSTWSTWANLSGSGFANPMTTKGDTIIGDTGGSPIRKAVGSDGQVLTADAASTGGIKWAAPSAFSGVRVTHNTTQAVTGSTAFLAFNSETGGFDTDAYHDTSTNNSRLTVPTGKGGYFIAGGEVEEGAAGPRLVLRKNGTTTFAAGTRSTGTTVTIGGVLIALADADYLELGCDTSNNGNILSQADSPWFWMYKVG